MTNQQDFIYTINSTDPEHYNRIQASLDIPNTEYSIFQVTELTTKCSILILTTNDYFTINGKQYFFPYDCTDLNSESFVELVDDMIADDGYYCEIDTASRIHLFAENEYGFDDASYNVKLLFGLHHNVSFPILSKYNPDIPTEQKQEILFDSVGFTLSTPILYLLSNIGARTFTNNLISQNKGYTSTLKTAMRINNSFSANYPIISGNSDFETIVKSNDLTNINFMLVDANLKEIQLLSPMYLTIRVQAIEDPDHNIYSIMLQQQQQQNNNNHG